MKKDYIKKIIVLVSISTILVSNTAGFALAKEINEEKSNITSESEINFVELTEKDIREFFTSNGVDKETANFLIGKINNGEIIDSVKGNENPVNSIKLNNGLVKNIYKDGSISVETDVDSIKNEISRSGEIGPTTSLGSDSEAFYYRTHISRNTGVYSYEYYVKWFKEKRGTSGGVTAGEFNTTWIKGYGLSDIKYGCSSGRAYLEFRYIAGGYNYGVCSETTAGGGYISVCPH